MHALSVSAFVIMQMSMNVPVVHTTAALMLCVPTVMAATYVAAHLDMMEMDMPVPVSHMCAISRVSDLQDNILLQ